MAVEFALGIHLVKHLNLHEGRASKVCRYGQYRELNLKIRRVTIFGIAGNFFNLLLVKK